MQQVISLVNGLDISNPVVGRTPAYSGGYFGLEANLPSSLRGPASGFSIEIMIRVSRGAGFPNGGPAIPEFEFLAGCYDFVNEAGWALMLNNNGPSPVVDAYIGDTILSFSVPPFGDAVMMRLDYDGTDASLYINGAFGDSNGAPIVYAIGPNNFGIGGTSHASLVTVFDTDAWGAVSTGIMGLSVSPFPTAAVDSLVNPPAANYEASKQANDVAQSTDPVAAPGAWNLFSVRRGLPQLRDNDNALWADEVSNTVLSRIGTQENASVLAMEPSYF